MRKQHKSITPPNQVWILPDFVSTCYSSQTTQITQPTSHWAWLFFKPSATWMHPSVPKSVNRTSCPAAFSDPNFGWDFRGLRAIDGANHVSRQWPPATWPQHAPTPQPARGPRIGAPDAAARPPPGLWHLMEKGMEKVAKVGGLSAPVLKKGWFFLEGGQSCQQKIHNFFKQLENLKNKLNTVHLKDCFFLEGGSKRCVNVKTNGEQKKRFIDLWVPSHHPPVAPMGFSSMTSCANVWLFFKPLKNAIAPGAKNHVPTLSEKWGFTTKPQISKCQVLCIVM